MLRVRVSALVCACGRSPKAIANVSVSAWCSSTIQIVNFDYLLCVRVASVWSHTSIDSTGFAFYSFFHTLCDARLLLVTCVVLLLSFYLRYVLALRRMFNADYCYLYGNVNDLSLCWSLVYNAILMYAITTLNSHSVVRLRLPSDESHTKRLHTFSALTNTCVCVRAIAFCAQE